MAPIHPREDDIVMESTTDTPAQVAEGLGVELAPVEETPQVVDDPAGPDASSVSEPEADAPAEPVAVTPGQISAEPAKVGAPRKARAKKVATPDPALETLRLENEALKKRIADAPVSVPAVQPPPVPSPPVPVASAPAVKPETLAAHPDMADIAARRTALGAKPSQDDFEDYEKFIDAKDAWLIKTGALDAEETMTRRQVAASVAAATAQAERDWNTTRTAFEGRIEAAKAKHADHDTVIAAAGNTVVAPHIVTAIVTSEVGGELRYHLAKNPGELARIQALPQELALMELGVLAASLKTGAPAKPAGRLTKAPEPQGTRLGDLPSTSNADDPDEPGISLAEYNRRRDRMDVQSGRRQSLTH